jgi:hypothetical protein
MTRATLMTTELPEMMRSPVAPGVVMALGR